MASPFLRSAVASLVAMLSACFSLHSLIAGGSDSFEDGFKE